MIQYDICRPQAPEACPGCGGTDTRRTATKPRVDARVCRCGLAWATCVVNAYLRGRAVEHVGAARWVLAEVVQLADEMPKLTDAELRTRLLALAGGAR